MTRQFAELQTGKKVSGVGWLEGQPHIDLGRGLFFFFVI